MPKKHKSGPPYADIPKEIYVVVTNPYDINPNPQLRGQRDFNYVASWAQFVLHQAGLGGGRLAMIECLYSMGSRDEVILQFQEGTDIIPLLGEHRWANIAKDSRYPPNDPRSTRVFIYNWRNNGDPANHNWTENFPKPFPLASAPLKSPYPAPSWVRPPHTLANFVHSIPHPPIPPERNHGHNPGRKQQSTTFPPSSSVIPSPAPPERQDQPGSGEQPVAQDSVLTNLFKPYEPPSQHPSHGQFLNRRQPPSDRASPPQATPPPPKFIKKLDPYELEEDALNALRSPEPSQADMMLAKDEDIEPIIPLSVELELPGIKAEDGDAHYHISSGSGSRYQPSQALIDAFNSLTEAEQIPSSVRPPTDPRRRLSAAPKTTPPASLAYKPSAELETEINSFLRGATAAASSASDAQPRAPSAVTIKREYEEEVVTSFEERKRIKIEEY